MNYGDLEQLWYNIHRGKGLSHSQVALIAYDLEPKRLAELRAEYEGGEIKAELGAS